MENAVPQSPETKPSTPDSNTPIGVLRMALGWVDRPWKVGAAMVLSALVLIGAIIWENRTQIVTVIISSDVGAQVRVVRAPAILSDLIRSAEADFAAIYRIDVERNRKRLLYAVGHQGRRLEIESVTQPVVRTVNSQTSIVLPALMLDQPPCLELNDQTDQDFRAFQVRGNIRFYCVSGVRTAFGALRGMLVLGFVGEVREPSHVIAMLRIAAQELMEPNQR